MKELTRINHIGLRVKDFAISRDFYAQLGFIDITGPTGPEPVAIVEHPCGININFILNGNQAGKNNVLMQDEVKHTGYTHVALEVTDAEAVIKQLEEMNIPLSGQPMKHITGTSFFIRDPDDNVIEFIEYNGIDHLRRA